MVTVPDPRRVDADRVRSIQAGTMRFRNFLSSFCPGEMLPIVMISESELLRATATDGRILRECCSGRASETTTSRNSSDRLSGCAEPFHRLQASMAKKVALSVAVLASRLTFVAVILRSPSLPLPAPGFLRRAPSLGTVFLA